MTLQAQYPSSIFHYNRNKKGRKNMIEAGYQKGIVLNQPPLVFSKQVDNDTLKMEREISSNFYPIQYLSPNTIMNVTQIHNPQVSKDLHLSLENPTQQLQQEEANFLLQASVPTSVSNDILMHWSPLTEELDHTLRSQEDQLRMILRETRQKQYRSLLDVARALYASKLKEKNAAIYQAKIRNAELTQKMTELKSETLAWQTKAQADQANAITLKEKLATAISEMKSKVNCSDSAASDAESVYLGSDRFGYPVLCHVCRTRYVSIVVLPCRHLCLCNRCDMALEVCPICLSVRNATIEVIIE